MSQYLDQQGLTTLVEKTKEYARKSAKEAVNTSAAAASKTITGWDAVASAAEYGNIAISEEQVTGLTADLNLKANLASPEFTGTPTTPTPVDPAHDSTQIANVHYVWDVVGNIGESMHYKGAVDSEHGLPISGYKAGDTYKVAAAGTYAGQLCEVGDMIIASKDYVESTASNADWNVIQTNIDGAVTGPGAANDGNFALFNGTTGKVIKDAGFGPEHFKTVQTTAAFTGDDLQTIDSITQNENGEISVTFQDIQSATTSQKGVVQLSNASASTAEDVAATPYAVKAAYDVLNAAKQNNLVFNGTYDADNNPVATVSTVTNAVGTAVSALDAEVTATGGKNVGFTVTEVDGKITAVAITADNTVNSGDVSSAITTAIEALDVGAITSTSGTAATITSISETDGKIAATYEPISITTSQISDFSSKLNSKADKVSSATAGNFAGLDANGNLTDSGSKASDFKTKQTAVSDPNADGNGITFIDSISQDTNGVITPHKKTVQSASSSQEGLMSSSDFTKLSGIATEANKVTIDSNGNLKATDAAGTVTTLMEPISTATINGLF